MCAVWTSALPRCGMHRYLVQRCYSTERELSALCVFPAGCKIWSPSEWVQTSCQKTPESSRLFDIINCSEWFDLWTRLCGVKEDLEQEDSNNIEQASEAGKLAFRPPPSPLLLTFHCFLQPLSVGWPGRSSARTDSKPVWTLFTHALWCYITHSVKPFLKWKLSVYFGCFLVFRCEICLVNYFHVLLTEQWFFCANCW